MRFAAHAPVLPVAQLLFACALLLPAPALAQTTTTSTTSSTSTTLNVNVPHGVVFAQPGYAVVANWSGTALGIPADLGGLLFSQDGAFLYVVGAVDEAGSALYRLNVVRNGFDEIVNLTGPAVAVFSGSAAGLDAGLDWGPGGNLFTTYLPAQIIAQQVGGLGGAEVTFDASVLSGFTTRGVGGLTFNPQRSDPQTGFGRMLANNGVSFDVREILLMPDGGGAYTPISSASFVQVQPSSGSGGMGQLQFLPAPFQGDLMYASYTDGELRIVDIDPATGLAYNEPSCGMMGCVPVLGTHDPIDTLFASGFGEDVEPDFDPGPFGLEVDPVTSDLFVTTSGGSPANVIFRITGFSGGGTTTTTVPTTTSTSTSSSSSSSTSSTTATTPSTSSSTSTSVITSTSSSTSLSSSTSSTTSSSSSTSLSSSTSSTTSSSSSTSLSSSTSSTTSSSSSTSLSSSTSSTTSSSSSTSLTSSTAGTSSSTSLTSTTTTTTTLVSSTTVTTTTTTSSTSTTTTLVGCGTEPRSDCLPAVKGALSVKEATAGKERLRLVLKKLVPNVTQARFGDPVSGTTRYDLCLYDEALVLAGSLTVDRAAAVCGTRAKPCWRPLSEKGYRYQDRDASADGVLTLVAKGGAARRGKVALQARNKASKGRISLPTGLTTALQGSSEVTVQVLTSDGDCFGGTLSDVSRADAGVFKAAGRLR